MSRWRQIAWWWRVGISLGAVFIVSVLIGVARGEWSKGWDGDKDMSVASHIGGGLGYTFASGFFTVVFPFLVLVVLPIAIIVGIVKIIRRQRRRSAAP